MKLIKIVLVGSKDAVCAGTMPEAVASDAYCKLLNMKGVHDEVCNCPRR